MVLPLEDLTGYAGKATTVFRLIGPIGHYLRFHANLQWSIIGSRLFAANSMINLKLVMLSASNLP
jgi:hypothetical protein